MGEARRSQGDPAPSAHALALNYTHLVRRVQSVKNSDEAALPLCFWPNDDWHFYHWLAVRMDEEGFLHAEVAPGEVAIHGLTDKGRALLNNG